jgi:hypothetical protein
MKFIIIYSCDRLTFSLWSYYTQQDGMLKALLLLPVLRKSLEQTAGIFVALHYIAYCVLKGLRCSLQFYFVHEP